MRQILAAAILAALGSSALADSCHPLSKDEFAAGAEIKLLTHDQLEFARGVFSATLPLSPYPIGDDALVAIGPHGSGVILFLLGTSVVCGALPLEADFMKLVMDLDKGT